MTASWALTWNRINCGNKHTTDNNHCQSNKNYDSHHHYSELGGNFQSECNFCSLEFSFSLFLTLKYQAQKLINYCCWWWLLLQQTKVKTGKELSFSHFIILNWQKPRSTFEIHIKTEGTEQNENTIIALDVFFLSFFFSPLVEISRHINTWHRTWKK